MSKTTNYSAREFYLDDFPKTLFPLSTNRVLVEHGSERLSEYAKQLIEKNHSFNNQQRVHANKDALHFRRTVKLDAVAEYFMYELIYKNRTLFKKPYSDDKRHYGYRFEKGRPISASRSYADFKEKINNCKIAFEEYISFDIAAYFNNIYHHDIQRWFGSTGADEGSVEALGKFLRETNAGRSLDCLPQGLYPSKMIGNDFLRFIEESAMLRSDAIIRFMDDVYLFDDDTSVVRSDFAAIQKLVGAKGLSINASKTQESGRSVPNETDDDIDELKKRLLRRRREIVVSHYDFSDIDIDFELDDDELAETDQDEEGAIESGDNKNGDEDLSNTPLSAEELDYLSTLLNKPHLSEEDAELILVVVRDNAEIISDHLPIFLEFPHLAKNFYAICKDIDDKETVSEVILSAIRSGRYVGEFQLFWFGFMLESYLMDTKKAPKLIRGLFNHPNATSITRAKILEIADNRYGLPDLRSQYLKDGRSDWLSWASAVGCRNMNAASRNYELKYFANGSDFNRLIAGIISDI